MHARAKAGWPASARPCSTACSEGKHMPMQPEPLVSALPAASSCVLALSRRARPVSRAGMQAAAAGHAPRMHAPPVGPAPSARCRACTKRGLLLTLSLTLHQASAVRAARSGCWHTTATWSAAWTSTWTCARAGIATGATSRPWTSTPGARTGRRWGCEPAAAPAARGAALRPACRQPAGGQPCSCAGANVLLSLH